MARMHQTTVRFSSDLWDELETECSSLGVSIAQYLREAAVARLAFTAARRGDPIYAAALDESIRGRALSARAQARAGAETTEAVYAQSRLARERARELRAQSEQRRHQNVRA